MRLWWLLIAACWTPAPKQEKPIYVPPDDEQKSVESRPDAMGGWKFDWESYRASYDKLMKTPVGSTKCDWRAKPRPDSDCPSLDRHAARVFRVDPDDADGVILTLDIGDNDKLTKEWWGALIDDKGRRVSDWVHPHHVARDISQLQIPRMSRYEASKLTRAALLKQKPEE